MAEQDQRITEARRIVSDFRGTGYTMRNGAAAWGAAIFGPLLAIPGVLVAIPVTAHEALRTDPAPIALLGTLFFGAIGYAGIKRVRAYFRARDYLRRHPTG